MAFIILFGQCKFAYEFGNLVKVLLRKVYTWRERGREIERKEERDVTVLIVATIVC